MASFSLLLLDQIQTGGGRKKGHAPTLPQISTATSSAPTIALSFFQVSQLWTPTTSQTLFSPVEMMFMNQFLEIGGYFCCLILEN
jgi:hypothetical protein